MLKFPNGKLKEFTELFQTHTANIAVCNIYFQTCRMLNKRHKIIDRKTYQDLFLNPLSDIELVTPPTDSFVPTDGTTDELFTINQLTPEFMEISKRMPLSLLESILGPANEIVVMVKNDLSKLEQVHEDLFLYYNFFKFIDQIDLIKLNIFSNYTPIIEYVVNEYTIDDWKDYLKTDKVNLEKYGEKCEDIIFNPDISSAQDFFFNKNDGDKIPKFDVTNLIQRMATNVVAKHDIIIVLGVYLTILFAQRDCMLNTDDSKCMEYVDKVLSKL